MASATLKTPDRGYRIIELIEKEGFKWKATISGSGREIYVYEDEFDRD